MSIKSEKAAKKFREALDKGQTAQALAVFLRHRQNLPQADKKEFLLYAMASDNDAHARLAVDASFYDFSPREICNAAMRFGRNDILGYCLSTYGYTICSSDGLIARAAFLQNGDALTMIAQARVGMKMDPQKFVRVEEKFTSPILDIPDNLYATEALLELDVALFEPYARIYFAQVNDDNNKVPIEQLALKAMRAGKNAHLNALAQIMHEQGYNQGSQMAESMVRVWWNTWSGKMDENNNLPHQAETDRVAMVQFLRKGCSKPEQGLEDLVDEVSRKRRDHEQVSVLYAMRDVLPSRYFAHVPELLNIWKENYMQTPFCRAVAQALLAQHSKIELEQAMQDEGVDQKKSKMSKKI